MPVPASAFRHHPHLAKLIEDPEASEMRGLDPANLDERMIESGFGPDWRYSHDERTRLWQEEIAGRMDRDFWVFGYGSLMWNPALIFDEVRRGDLPGHVRRMCLLEILGARGTREAPGLVAGLDVAEGYCTGLVFRIPAALVAEETENLWRRERLRPGYRTTFMEVATAAGTVEALAFVVDHDAPEVDVTLTRADQVRLIRQGKGALGTSLDYLRGMVNHLRAFEIHDDDLEGLLSEVHLDRLA